MPDSEVYDPFAYFLQSGSHVGQTPTLWVFNNPRRFMRFLRRRQNEYNLAKRRGRDPQKDKLHRALEAIYYKRLQAQVHCPYCGHGPVMYFAVLRTGELIATEGRMTSCESLSCMAAMRADAAATGHLDCVLQLRFADIYSAYSMSSDRKMLADFVRCLLGITGRLSFKKAYSALTRQAGFEEESPELSAAAIEAMERKPKPKKKEPAEVPF